MTDGLSPASAGSANLGRRKSDDEIGGDLARPPLPGHGGSGPEWRDADAAMHGSSGTQRFQPWQLLVA